MPLPRLPKSKPPPARASQPALAFDGPAETSGGSVAVPNPPQPFDPRPDLTGDHARWVVLLALAWETDGLDPAGVYGALYRMRCCGAQLVSEEQPGECMPGNHPRWRLLPGAELAQAEWLALRTKWLAPHQVALTRLLQGEEQT